MREQRGRSEGETVLRQRGRRKGGRGKEREECTATARAGKKVAIVLYIPLESPSSEQANFFSLSLSDLNPHPSINTSTHGASLWMRVWHLSQPFPRKDSTYRPCCWWPLTSYWYSENGQKKRTVIPPRSLRLAGKLPRLLTPHLYPPTSPKWRSSSSEKCSRRLYSPTCGPSQEAEPTDYCSIPIHTKSCVDMPAGSRAQPG